MARKLEQLMQLQELDRALGHLKRQQEEIPKLLAEFIGPVEAIRSQTSECRDSLESLSTNRRSKEQDLANQEDRVSKLRGRQTEIKTNKEYQAHIQELEAAKSLKTKIEDELLTMMEQMEATRAATAKLEAELVEAEKRFETEKTRIEQENAGAVSELKTLEAQRVALCETMDAASLAAYQKLRKSRKEMAVVPIKSGNCAGCHMSIPPQLVAEVKRQNQDELFSCSHCHRILYWLAPVAAEPTSQRNSS